MKKHIRATLFFCACLFIGSRGYQIAREPDNRFSQVCDASTGYSGITIAIHAPETKIRCSLRCRSLPECQLASYSEVTRTCTLKTNVTQICSEMTTDIQLMDENDIDPVVFTTSATTAESTIDDTATTESSTMTSDSSTVVSGTSSGAQTSASTNVSTSETLTFTSVTGMKSASTTPVATSSSSTTQTTFSTSMHPWVVTLTKNVSQNESDVSGIDNLINYGVSGSDLNLLVQTANAQISMPVDLFKVGASVGGPYVKNIAFYVHSFYQARKSMNYFGVQYLSELSEFAWPGSGSTVTDDSTEFESISIFTRDYSGKYTFDLGYISDIGFVRDILKRGGDIRVNVYDDELYSADIVYFDNDTDTMFALARRHTAFYYKVSIPTLEFAHILYTIDSVDSTMETLTTNQDGVISITKGNSADDWTQIYVQGDWTKVYEVAGNGSVTHGTFSNLRHAIRQGHRAKVMIGEDLIAVPDYIIEVSSEGRILAVILDEFVQYNGSFTTQEGRYRKVWREYDTNGSEKKCFLSTDDAYEIESRSNVMVAWFIDTAPWAKYYANSDSSIDTSSLKRSIEFGSRVRLMYNQMSNPGPMRVYLDVPVVTIRGGHVEAKTPSLLDYDFSPGAPMCGSDTKYLHFIFSTDGKAEQYLRTLGRAGADSASTSVGYYDVTWFTDEVRW